MKTTIQALGRLVAVCIAVVGLGACSGYDVQLEGGLFDATGLSSIGKKQVEPKLRKRNSLVVPPTTASLPVPGSTPARLPAVAVAANNQAWPIDPERSQADKQAAIVNNHKAFCEKALQGRDARGDAPIPEGPLGSCEESVIRNITGQRVLEARAKPKQ